MSSPVISKSKAREQLWRMGHLVFLLDSNQKALYEMFHKNPAKLQTWLLARRSGKSYTLCVLAIEFCIKNPNSIIKYVAPTKDQVETIILPMIENQILNDGGCPQDLKPKYNKTKHSFIFPNGSMIQIAGSEKGNIESLRGTFCHIGILDEAQDITGLRNAISSVIAPTTLTTNGKILISGTPPKDTDHEFIEYIESAEANGTLVRRTVYDNPRLTKQQIQDQIDIIGGEDKEEFQREFLCKIIKSKTRSVLPEVTDELLSSIAKTWARPAYYNSYTGMDVGGKDWTVVLFGYYDFLNHKIIIEDEYAIAGSEMKLPVLTSNIEVKELDLCTSPLTGEYVKIKKRVSDHNLIVINEIKRISGYKIHFELADKKEKMVNINNLRTLLNSENIIINPRCVTLIRHLKNVKWASENNKDDYAKSADGGHYDAVDALLYLVKAMAQDMQNNPFPKGYTMNIKPDDLYTVKKDSNIKNAEMYKKMLGIKSTNTNTNKNAWQKHFNKKEK